MSLFGSRKKTKAEDISVVLEDKDDGYTYLIVNGITYGMAKPGGYLIVNQNLPTLQRSEALLGLVRIEVGKRDVLEIAKSIAEFRQSIQNRNSPLWNEVIAKFSKAEVEEIMQQANVKPK